ncbi:MAG TPA: branched-chain amino acid ABC transporter permease, partial [Bauldia sp.]|nr:branched-chain amino acid ABC transporter permease [Bauldia sp.]
AATVALALLGAVPFFVSNLYVLHVLILALIYATFGIGWGFLVGEVGLKSFGHQAFFGIAAYTSALLSIRLGLDPWLSIPVAVAAAGAAGLLMALPSLQIKSVAHLAIVSLAFAEIVRITCANLEDLTNGEIGLWGIKPLSDILIPGLAVIRFSPAEKFGYYLVAFAMLVGAVVAVALLSRSRFGLAITAIRDAEPAAESLGINLASYKVWAFTISAVIVGFSGAFYAHYILLLTPTSVLGPDVMISVIAIVLVGGLGSVAGTIVSALLLAFAGEALRDFGLYGAVAPWLARASRTGRARQGGIGGAA